MSDWSDRRVLKRDISDKGKAVVKLHKECAGLGSAVCGVNRKLVSKSLRSTEAKAYLMFLKRSLPRLLPSSRPILACSSPSSGIIGGGGPAGLLVSVKITLERFESGELLLCMPPAGAAE